MEKFPESNTPVLETKESTVSPIEAIETIENSFEVSPTLDDNIAICVIKPDAFIHRGEIVKRLESSGLYIVQRTVKELNEEFVVGKMYGADDLPKPIAEATKRHFLGGPSEIVLVKGDDVVHKLLNLVGLKTNPALCDPETVRFIYGDHIPEELEGGLKYYKNAAHRPTNVREAQEDLDKFRDLL